MVRCEAEANSIMDEMNAAMVKNYKAKIKLGTLQTKSWAVAENNHHQLVVCSRHRDGHDACDADTRQEDVGIHATVVEPFVRLDVQLACSSCSSVSVTTYSGRGDFPNAALVLYTGSK